jgi:hypothetical protein
MPDGAAMEGESARPAILPYHWDAEGSALSGGRMVLRVCPGSTSARVGGKEMKRNESKTGFHFLLFLSFAFWNRDFSMLYGESK